MVRFERFVEQEGPTALRPDLVRALALSRWADLALDGEESGPERCCAGVCAVWNGRRGHVVVLVRFLERPRMQRYVYQERIRDEAGLAAALAEALLVARDLGFELDAPDFQEQSGEHRGERLRCWNQLRKTYRWPRYLGLAEDPSALARSGLSQPERAGDEERSVLGRIGIVQRVQSRDGTGMDSEGRLLSFF